MPTFSQVVDDFKYLQSSEKIAKKDIEPKDWDILRIYSVQRQLIAINSAMANGIPWVVSISPNCDT